MKITVVGTGYVGLVTGTCFAHTGNEVVCVDIDKEKVKLLQSGVVPIYEPGLESIFEKNIAQDRLHFTTDLKEGIEGAEIIMLALPTPPGEDGSADLSYILKVAEDLSKIITDYKVIVDKSTVPVGTAELVNKTMAENLSEELFDVVSNPEFLREGVAVDDFMKPDRVVIGTSSEKAARMMERLYEPFVRQGNPILFMDERSAEMTKYAANSYLATRITFMNEIANLCEKVGADVNKVRKGMGSDTRIGKRFLFPGIGYGGSCFPKDVKALYNTAQENEYDFQILDAVMSVNQTQKLRLVDKVVAYFGQSISSRTIAVWGLAFKPNTDDIREAPAIDMINALVKYGCEVKVYDPEAMQNVRRLIGDAVVYAENQYDAVKDAHALLIATEWSAFRSPDFNKIKSLLLEPVIMDGRNLFEPDDMKNRGFHYEAIGR